MSNSSSGQGINNPAFVKAESIFTLPEVVKINDLNIKQDNQNESVLYVKNQITFRGWIVVFSIGAACFAAFASYSLVAPFFQIGLKMTPKYMLMTGLVIIAWCSVIFRFLVYAKNGSEFFVLCLIVRVAWSIGGASASVASNTLGTLLFPNHIALLYAAVQIGAGGGLVAGPFFGGLLFEKGGFPLPFITMSIISILSLIPLALLVDNELRAKDRSKKNTSVSVFRAMRVPGVSINLLISAITSLTIGFNESTLDFHLQEISKFSPSETRRLFLITGLVYTFFTLLVSRIASRYSKAYYLVIVGVLMMSFSLTILGPVHGLNFKPNVYYVILSQISFGIAMAALYVLSFDDYIKQAKIHLPDTDQMIATVNGLFTSSYGVGVGCGPFIAGRLIEDLGYRKALVPIILIIVALSVLIMVYIFMIRKKTENKNVVP